MAEYISREAVIEFGEQQLKRLDDGEAYRRLDAWLNSIPDADVRPVVFCKDCVHAVKGKKSLECEKHRYVWNNMNRWVNDEDFCCWGEKREA